jgi:pyruvate/2-oxoglutarate dehydrogenase complex dihydrolipoamide acyltransferase (E2) component
MGGVAARKSGSMLSATAAAATREQLEEIERLRNADFRRAARLKMYTADELQRELEVLGYKVKSARGSGRGDRITAGDREHIVAAFNVLCDLEPRMKLTERYKLVGEIIGRSASTVRKIVKT